MTETLILNFDGGSRGNPGPAAYGIVLRAQDGTPISTIGRFIGTATNNVAEYKALIAGLHEAKRLGAQRIVVRGDSQLIIRQMTGEYRVKHAVLIPLHQDAKKVAGQFASVSYEYRPREENALADALANKAIDCRAEVNEADEADDKGAMPTGATEPKASGGASPESWKCSTCDCEIHVTHPPRSPNSAKGGFTCICGGKMLPGGKHA
jgi:probable phosphoglycerate mutase